MSTRTANFREYLQVYKALDSVFRAQYKLTGTATVGLLAAGKPPSEIKKTDRFRLVIIKSSFPIEKLHNYKTGMAVP